MKSAKQLFLTILTLTAVFANGWAQTSDSATPAPKKKNTHVAAPSAITAADVQSLKDALAAQQ